MEDGYAFFSKKTILNRIQREKFKHEILGKQPIYLFLGSKEFDNLCKIFNWETRHGLPVEIKLFGLEIVLVCQDKFLAVL